MKILLVAATEFELKPLREKSVVLAAQEGRYSWKWQSFTFDVLITGVGMVATAYQLGKTLANRSYDIVINVGIAGAFDRSLALGTVCRVVEDQFSELGAEDGVDFIGIEEMGFGQSVYRESYTGDCPQWPSVTSTTVNLVHGNEATIARLEQRLSVQLESMEGAAVFYVCTQEKQPVLQVRAISNYVEQRNRAAWDIPLAIEKLNDGLLALLKEFV